jgi:LacI family transcriptional regulator
MAEDSKGPPPKAKAPGPERRRARLTIRDVARASNVSIGTVSKALNNNGHMRPETREKILAAARELGFRPNDLAQSLHRGQSFTVGVISTDAFGRFTMPIVEGIEECLTDRRMAGRARRWRGIVGASFRPW